MPILGIIASAGSHGKYWIGEYFMSSIVTSESSSEPGVLQIDSSNNIFCSNVVIHSTINSFEKFSYDGQFVFDETLGTASSNIVATSAMTMDSSGNIIIGGASQTSGGQLLPFVAKYSPAGSLVWQKSFTSSNISGSYSSGTVLGISIDSSNNINVTGQCPNNGSTGYQNEMFVMQLNSSGAINWQTTQYVDAGSSVVSGAGYAIQTDSSNNVYVSATIEISATSANQMAILFKYSSSGFLQWSHVINSLAYGYPGSQAMFIDSSGNVYVGYSLNTSTGYVSKISPSGAFLGGITINYPSSSIAGIYSINEDSVGNIYISTTHSIIKCGPIGSTGASLIWARQLKNSTTGTPIATKSFINSQNVLVATGRPQEDIDKNVILSLPNNGSLTGIYTLSTIPYQYVAVTGVSVSSFSESTYSVTLATEASNYTASTTTFATASETNTYHRQAIG